MDAEQCEQLERIQQTIMTTYALRSDRGSLARKAMNYRQRALCLVEQLRREREYRRSAERLAEALLQHAGQVEQELNNTLQMLARAGATLYECDGKARDEFHRPDPKLLNEITFFVVQHARSCSPPVEGG